METILAIRVGVTALVGLVALLTGAWGQRRQRPRAWSHAFAIALGLVVLIWAPPVLVNVAVAGVVAVGGAQLIRGTWQELETLWLRLAAMALLGGLTYLTVRPIPGGAETVVAGLGALIGLRATAKTLGFLVRRARAQRLLPDERSSDEVEVAGRLPEETVAPPELYSANEPMAAWRLSWEDQRRASPVPLSLQTEHGQVLVDLERVDLASNELRRTKLDAMEAQAIGAAMGDDELADYCAERRSEGEAYPVELAWLPPGAAVYVVGRPAWRRVAGSSYRDGQIVPCFEGDGDDLPVLVDQSAEEHDREMKWNAILGAGWGLVAGVVALLKLAGLL